MRKSTWILSGTAAVLIAGSAVTRLAVYPAVHQVPSDTDVTIEYAGAVSMLNAAALESGDPANAFLSGVPVTLDRRVQVVDTDGRTAVFSDESVVTAQDGTELSTTAHRWAVDRRDLDERPAPEGSGAEEHQGLVISWPLEPEERDYTFWDAVTATEVPAVYDRTEELEGRDAYVFTMSAAGPLADPAIAERLPAALPRELLAGLVGALPAGQAPDPSALGALPETVPLQYAARVERVAWVDSETGSVLRGSIDQTIVAQTPGPDGLLVLAPVSAIAVESTDDSVREQADDAEAAARSLWLVRVLAPLGLLGAAVLLILLAVWRETRGRNPRSSTDDGPAAPEGPTAA